MLEIFCSTYKSGKEILFVNLYKSSKIAHAEAYMHRDINRIVDKTRQRRDELIHWNHNISPLSVNIFLSNSPCNQCATAIIRLQEDLQSSLQCQFLNFHVYSVRLWKPEENESGLRKLYGSVGIRLIAKFNWLEFYDAFCKWMEINYSTFSFASRPKTDVEVISRLMDLSKEWGITYVKEMTEKTTGDLIAMTHNWELDHCHYQYHESLN